MHRSIIDRIGLPYGLNWNKTFLNDSSIHSTIHCCKKLVYSPANIESSIYITGAWREAVEKGAILYVEWLSLTHHVSSKLLFETSTIALEHLSQKSREKYLRSSSGSRCYSKIAEHAFGTEGPRLPAHKGCGRRDIRQCLQAIATVWWSAWWVTCYALLYYYFIFSPSLANCLANLPTDIISSIINVISSIPSCLWFRRSDWLVLFSVPCVVCVPSSNWT